MKIIMLEGKKNSGKTTTFNNLYDELVNNKKGTTIIKAKQDPYGDPEDFECIIKYDDKKIALFTVGDYSKKITDAFKKYEKLKCDILICACNKNHKRPYQAIKKYPHKILKKTVEIKNNNKEKCEQANIKDVKQIISYI